MSSTLIPFGLLEGVLKRAIDVPNGLACGCLCPGCRSPLVAANQGMKNVPHFRHAQAVACQGAYETALHRAAKELLVAKGVVSTPIFDERVTAEGLGASSHRRIHIGSTVVTAEHAQAEFRIDGVVSDVVFRQGKHLLLIEIHVSHKVDRRKQMALRTLDHSSFEIDLRNIKIEAVVDPVAFEFEVLHNLDNRKWLHSRLGARLVSNAVHELQRERAAERDNERIKAIEKSAELTRQKELRALYENAKRAVVSDEVAQEQASPEAKVYRENLREVRDRVLGRAKAIAGSIARVVTEFGGQAMQCQKCWMASGPESESCIFCGAVDEMVKAVFTADYARTAEARMRCSPKPDDSLKRAPHLKLPMCQ